MVAPRRDEGLDSARRHADAGEFDEALGELKRILVADPSDTEACVVLGDIYMQAHQGVDAVQAHFDLGITSREMGLIDQALDAFGVALEASVRRAECLRARGSWA